MSKVDYGPVVAAQKQTVVAPAPKPVVTPKQPVATQTKAQNSIAGKISMFQGFINGAKK